MSDHWWIKSLAGGLVILMLGIASSKGNVEECSLCCTLQETIEDLNCTWSNNSSLELNAILQKITKPHDFPRNYTIPPGRKWLLIPRENLIKSLKYQLIINGGTWMETLTFTYCHGCENVLIGAPVLHSSISEEDDTLVVDVKWENQDSLAVELRYRILGASEWILVHSNDQEPDCYRMRDPEPYTDYEFQIRYIPNEHQKSSSLWSTSYVLTTVPIGTLDIWRRMEQGNLLVTWKPLSPYNNKGKIFSYKVTYDYNNKLQTTEKPCCSIILPAPSTNVCVSARNSTGLGPVTCITPLCSVVANMDDFGGKAWGDPSGGIAVWWKESLNYGFPVNYVVEWRKENSTEMDWTRSQKAGQTVVLPGKGLLSSQWPGHYINTDHHINILK
ncbi:interleukin-27 receptor subunit alpha [Pyxicephalus adspersus]|uniref:interleukin-27 receptor subunit alpha n=1 Tax=Pyxicephalus adspersus TaxID=30357 RepID=UPI003B59E7E1